MIKPILILLAIVLPCLILAYLVEVKTCDAKGEYFDNHHFTFWGGCIVEFNGREYPLDNVKVITND